LDLAIRSLLETVAGQRIIARRKLFNEDTLLARANKLAEILAIKLQSLRKAIAPKIVTARIQN